MKRLARPLALLAALACEDALGPVKPPSDTNDLVAVVTTLATTNLARGDTVRFVYSIENKTDTTILLRTATGCQIKPELDQVDGKRMNPPPLSEIFCPSDTTKTTLTARQKVTFSTILLRGYDPTKPTDQQIPGYLLTNGVYDASALVKSVELPVLGVRSDWVRFSVQ